MFCHKDRTRFMGLFAVGASLLLTVGAFAQRPEVEKLDGHISPLMAEVTYPNGTKRTEMILGISDKFRIQGQDSEGVE